MAIGINSAGAAASIFGSATGETIFAVGVTAGATPAQQAAKVSIKAAEREINRIRGYKLDLTPADQQRLKTIREKITAIDRKAAEGTIREDEIEDRSELFREADEIIGKPSADVEADSVLEGLREKIDDLLAPKLDRPRANRLEQLEKLKVNIEEQISNGEGGQTAINRVRIVSRLINDINVPRNLHELSQSERAEYDDLVEQVNEHAGGKLVLNAKESDRVYNLQKTIDDLTASLPPDTSGDPTSADVARAYSRIG